MVSYASDVKKELTSLPVHPEHAKAELAAFLRMNGVLSLHDHQFSLDITTENPAIARRIFSLIKTAYGIEPLLIVSKKMKLKKNYQYLVRLQKQVHEILSDLEIFDSDNGLIWLILILKQTFKIKIRWVKEPILSASLATAPLHSG